MPKEQDWIERFFAPLSRLPITEKIESFALQDDAALWGEIVLTKDMLVAGTHFLPATQAGLVAQKAVAVNVADLASKSALPFAALLGLGLPANAPEAWVQDFAKGLKLALQRYHIRLVGGDTTRAPVPTISLTLLGKRKSVLYPKRTGAQKGHLLFCTRNIGEGWLGLRDAKANQPSPARKHYEVPKPPLAFGVALAGLMSASCDISDGLWQDAQNLAKNVALEINADAIPLSSAGKTYLRQKGKLENLLTGGEDYQLLFTAPARHKAQIFALASKHKTPCTHIGIARAGKGVQFLRAGKPMRAPKRLGFQHFTSGQNMTKLTQS